MHDDHQSYCVDGRVRIDISGYAGYWERSDVWLTPAVFESYYLFEFSFELTRRRRRYAFASGPAWSSRTALRGLPHR